MSGSPVPLKRNLEKNQQKFAAIAAELAEAVSAKAFPGCAFAVLHNGELVASQAIGRFTYESTSPAVGPDSIFDLASLTKIVATTAMAMILYQRGILDLDMPVVAAMPEFYGDAARNQVTLRHLLAHTSGLPGYVRLFETEKTREELVLAACRTPLEAAPGERTMYSDIGFIILGDALVRLADERFDRFCTREIFGPLGMRNTCFNPPENIRLQTPPTEDDRVFRRRVIQGEVNDENAGVMRGIAGHAGLFSNTSDLARFANAILHGGLVRPDTLHVFAQPQPARAGEARALGFDLPSAQSQSGKYFSRRSLGHLGFTGTSLWMDPERDLAIVMLTNRTWPDRSSQAIKHLRPAVHDAICEALGLAPAKV